MKTFKNVSEHIIVPNYCPQKYIIVPKVKPNHREWINFLSGGNKLQIYLFLFLPSPISWKFLPNLDYIHLNEKFMSFKWIIKDNYNHF